MERLCCPFVNYTLEIEPNRGPFWLRMTGGEGVKEFLKMAFEAANYFDPQVAKAAGLNISASPEIDSVATALEVTDKLNEQYARTIVSK
jgi:glutamate/tyrosine decarboxylase-like PLP-dependent enzyme